jgi:hypothetical protein
MLWLVVIMLLAIDNWSIYNLIFNVPISIYIYMAIYKYIYGLSFIIFFT